MHVAARPFLHSSFRLVNPGTPPLHHNHSSRIPKRHHSQKQGRLDHPVSLPQARQAHRSSPRQERRVPGRFQLLKQAKNAETAVDEQIGRSGR